MSVSLSVSSHCLQRLGLRVLSVVVWPRVRISRRCTLTLAASPIVSLRQTSISTDGKAPPSPI